MSTIPRVAQCMHRVLTDFANEAAKKSGFIQRQRKLDGGSFVQSLVFGWLANPHATNEERAQVAAARGVQISAYGLDKRLLTERAAECLRLVLEAAVGQAIAAADPAAVPILRRFSGVYVYDSSMVSLPEALRQQWPSLGGNGPDVGAAALKIGVRFDLLGGELYGPVLGAGRQNDQRLPLKAEALPPGALRLADLGFFDLELFRSIGENGGYWLSRLKGASVLREVTNPTTGDRLDLLALLDEKLAAAPGETLEIEVLVGDRARLPARLLAVRVPEAVAKERRRKLRLDAKKRLKPAVSEARLALAQYTVLISDAPAELLTAEEALVMMRARWQVEKLFDLWKRYGSLDKSRSKKPWRVLCEVYAKLLGLLVQHWIFLSSTAFWADPYRSLIKAGRTVRQRALALSDALDDPGLLLGVLTTIADCLGAGCRVAKRRKEPGTAQQLLALTTIDFAGEEAAVAA